MGKGPLVVRWGDWTLEPPQAGTVTVAKVELENAGTVRWWDTIRLSYHWLDDHGNAIVWDGIRTTLPRLAPGESVSVDARVRAPIPPGRYRFAFDLVAEDRAWFAELGNERATAEIDVKPREAATRALLGPAEPASDWQERVAAAHAEGYAVVAGAVDWDGGFLHRRPRALEPYRPGVGRIPGFPHALLCPSVVEDVALEPLPDVEGLPAFAAPPDEPWLYDGRVRVVVRPG